MTLKRESSMTKPTPWVEIEEKMIKQVRENYKDHVLTIIEKTPKIILVRWGNPKSNFYSVYYSIYGNTLCCFGDVDEAIYRWNNSISFEFLADCDIRYFAQKMKAGTKFDWNHKKALESLYFYLYNEDNSENKNITPDFEEKMIEACSDSLEWTQFLMDDYRYPITNGEQLFGSDYWEYGNIGECIPWAVYYHLEGIKMAYPQLGILKHENSTN